MHNNNKAAASRPATNVTSTADEDELDKLLLGLDKLTETLPDFGQSKVNAQLSEAFVTQPRLANNMTEVHQPYHTRADSKPFSYFRTRPNNSGLESPCVLRKIMGNGSVTSNNGGGFDSLSSDSRPLSPSVISRGSSPGLSDLSRTNPNMADLESASLTWLERQQKKLADRRAAQRRRECGGHISSDLGLMRELKTSLERARSETASYAASETASNSTRESSPHKPRIVPIQVMTSTPKTASRPQPQPDLTRHMSESSYDRSRPLIQRRLRYDSETSVASNTSFDSLASRPITPGFPTVPPTPVFGQPGSSSGSLKRQGTNGIGAPSPSGNSTYNSHATSRRGSFSSEPAEVAPSHVQLAKDHYKFWYKPHISREEAISLLRPHGPGTFVVRDSNSFPGAFGLALKVATPPANAPPSSEGDELIRHFLVEPTSKGVKLKGYSNEPVFASLSALVYQHTVTPLALPTRLVLPSYDLAMTNGSSRDSVDSKTSMQQLLALGAACNVVYLFSMETDSLTGPNAVKKAVSQLMLSRPKPHATLVHFKVSGQGITLTDHGRKLFFRKHYSTPSISFCGIDPEDRRWAMKAEATSQRIFGFVAKKATSRAINQCHLFAEQDPDQPARAIVNFVNKILLNSGQSSRSDVV